MMRFSLLLRAFFASLAVFAANSAFAQPGVTGDKMAFQMTMETKASKDEVYALWSDPNAWSAWDSQVSSVKFSGKATPGATGKIKGSGGPENKFVIDAAEPDDRFAYKISSAIGTVKFIWFFEEGEPQRITHRVEFKGGLLANILSKRFQEGLPGAMQSLVKQAETNSTQKKDSK